MIDRVLEIARNGMIDALQRVSDSAERISRAYTSEESDDPSSDIVNLKIDSTVYKANAKVIEVGDELTQSVLDLLA